MLTRKEFIDTYDLFRNSDIAMTAETIAILQIVAINKLAEAVSEVATAIEHIDYTLTHRHSNPAGF